MKKRNVLLILLVLLSLGIWGFWRLGWKREKDERLKLQVGSHQLLVEVASTSEQREKGLSGRKSLCDDCGLLFIFGQPGVYPFWMRRMYFDIDIIWIAGDRVVDITYNAKAPSKEDFDQPKEIYKSKVPVDKVLEINEGWVEKNGIKIGNEVKYPSRPL